MTDEKIIEKLLEKANICYKRAFRKQCPRIARMLDRKETVTLNGQDYNCWTELIVTTCGSIINDYCPDAEVEIELDGNNSSLHAILSDKDEEVLATKIQAMVE